MTPGTSPVLALHRKLRLDENGSGVLQNANSWQRGAWRRAPPGRARAEGEGEVTSPRPTGHPWTLAEDKQLQTLLDSGMKVAAIAQKMKHTVGAIHSRKSILRKALRVQEAHEAIADHEDAQKAFHENRERLREERLARETAAGPMLYPAPEIPDDTLIDNVRFS